MKLIFATNNQHKADEIRHMIGDKFEILTLRDAGIDIDIPEPHPTLEGNASEKSHTIFKITQLNCFGEDTGLEVTSLGGEPGVRSARYAGEGRVFDENIDKLLMKLEGKLDRSARFRTVISLILEGKETQFEGVCSGRILPNRRGDHGFGYDPVFIPDGAEKTFAEMDISEKETYSHRAKATGKLVTFLTKWSREQEVPAKF
jgi:XTP/dITP diphosphohydrolase